MEVVILKKKMEINIFLIFDSTNKKLIGKFTKISDEISLLIKTINDGKEIKYGKDFMKIKFNSDVDFPLNKSLKFHVMTIIIKSVFEENGKFYPQINLSLLFFFLSRNFNFEEYLCNSCHDTSMISYELENIAILNVKGVDYRCALWGVSKNEAVNLIKKF